MGDENHGFPGLLPHPQQLLVEVIAHDFIERTEGLIHQQQRRIERQRAGDRGPLLHAARKLPGKLALETRQVDEPQIVRRARAPFLPRDAHDFEGQHDIALDRAPRIERGRLEDIAIVPLQPCLFRRDAVDQYGPLGWPFEVGDDTQQSGLAAARGPDE